MIYRCLFSRSLDTVDEEPQILPRRKNTDLMFLFDSHYSAITQLFLLQANHFQNYFSHAGQSNNPSLLSSACRALHIYVILWRCRDACRYHKILISISRNWVELFQDIPHNIKTHSGMSYGFSLVYIWRRYGLQRIRCVHHCVYCIEITLKCACAFSSLLTSYLWVTSHVFDKTLFRLGLGGRW